MSHFSVAVITKGIPSDDDLTAVLQPWHEFECTGKDDQYVIDVDKTEEITKDYFEDTTTRLRAPDGTLHEPYDDQFYRDPTPEEQQKIGPIAGTGGGHGMSWLSKDWGDGRGDRAKVRFVPDGYAEVTIPMRDVQTLSEYVSDYHGKALVAHGDAPDLSDRHKYGYALLDANGAVAKIIDRTNPNAEWDWWVIGGRYSGRLIPKIAASSPGKRGKPGSFGNGPQHRDGVDQLLVKDIDFEFMRHQNVIKARREIEDTVTTIARKHGILPGDVLENHAAYCDALGAMRKLWESTGSGQAFYTFLQSNPNAETYRRLVAVDGGCLVGMFSNVGCPETERDPYAWADSLPALFAFAFVKDGKWAERGDMGWWGVVHREKDAAAWDREFQNLLSSLSPDDAITIVDCHI